MCSGEAPDDSANAFVSASTIFGTDSSVTRLSYSLTSIHGISVASFVPRFGVATPAMGVVAFHDHPGVLLQLGRVEYLEQRLGHPLDQLRLELRRQPALEQLDAHQRHHFSTCCAPPSGPSTRSR